MRASKEPRLSSRPVRDASGRVSRFDLEIGDPLPEGGTLSWHAWLEALRAAGWTEFAADGWACPPLQWLCVADVLRAADAREGCDGAR